MSIPSGLSSLSNIPLPKKQEIGGGGGGPLAFHEWFHLPFYGEDQTESGDPRLDVPITYLPLRAVFFDGTLSVVVLTGGQNKTHRCGGGGLIF